MKKNNEREPDLIQYRLEYSLNADLPSERFLMATDPRDALSQLAYLCIKHIPVDNFTEEEQQCFAKAFANPSKSFIDKPELSAVPDPIQDIEFPEPEPEPPSKETVTPKEEDINGDTEEGFLGMSEEEDSGNTAPDLQPKPDPAAEHKAKQDERLAQIAEIEKHNRIIVEQHEKLVTKTQRILEWFTPRIEIFIFEEHNRWSDSWTKLEYPLPPDQDAESPEVENIDSTESTHVDH